MDFAKYAMYENGGQSLLTEKQKSLKLSEKRMKR
jgi:hypothetical protein